MHYWKCKMLRKSKGRKVKELSLCHKLKLSDPYIYGTGLRLKTLDISK